MSLTVAELRTYIRSEFNVLLVGKHGTGKTTMLIDACAQENYTLKIFNAASMDAYTDLVGVPKFVTREDGTEELKNIRPRSIDEAEVIFIDELNRAFDPKTTNAVFELIQFRSINGEKLPKLKCVIAAQNPVTDEAYDVTPLDPALEDRFHLIIDVEPHVSQKYLSEKLDENIATALVEWYNGHNSKTSYISPRRIEMLGQVYSKTKSRKALQSAMPTQGKFDVGKLFELLEYSCLSEKEKIIKQKEKEEQLQRLTTIKNDNKRSAEKVIKIVKTPRPDRDKYSDIRKAGSHAVKDALLDNNLTPTERRIIIDSVSSNIGIDNFIENWNIIFSAMTNEEIKTLRKKFGFNKNNSFRREILKRLDRGEKFEENFVREMTK